MSDPLKRVIPGERLRTRADTHNAFVEAVAATRALGDQGNGRGGSGRSTLRPGQVLVRNDSGEDRDQFDVLYIGAIVIEPADNLQEWAERFAFAAQGTAGASGAWVVLAEPIGDGRFGRAWISGAHPARVTGTGETAQYGTVSALELGDGGDATVIWEETVEDTDEEHYAIILRGGGGGGRARLGCVTEDWTANQPVTVRLVNPAPAEGEEAETVEALAPNTSGVDTAGLRVLLIPLAKIDADAVLAPWAIVPRECEPTCEES